MHPYDFFISPWALAFVGLFVGSFLNVVIHRLPLMMQRQWEEEGAQVLGVERAPGQPAVTLSMPRSRCPNCGHQITWTENIPVLSYLLLKGRCSGCSAPISMRYPLIEAGTCVLFVLMWVQFGSRPQALLWCGFAAALVALAWIDWDTTYLPDEISQPLLWAGLVASAAGWLPGVALKDAIWGAVLGYLFLWTVYWAFKLVTGKEGMGYGDFKLMAALGAWLGWQAIPQIVVLSAVMGSIAGIAFKLRGTLREGDYYPFGPFIAGAGAVAVFAQPQAVARWLAI